MTQQMFSVRLSGFLRRKLDELKAEQGEDSPAYLGLARQYLGSEQEQKAFDEHGIKHYEASVTTSETEGLPGIERLYRRALVIETTLACAAHCRYCLRQNYPPHTLTEEQLLDVARYCGSPQNRDDLTEVLITGGDPMLIPHRLETLLNALIEHAPNIRTVRLGTRLFGHDPGRVDEHLLNIFRNKPSLRFEVATQINHPVEFFPEMIDALRKVQDVGAKIYSQNVLLKHINDDLGTLVELYDKMRQNNVEAHYLFHPVPLLSTHHFRNSLDRGLELARQLTSCGAVSGRAKPMFAVMADIGKITLYEGSIIKREGQRVLFQSGYTLADRVAWNPSWQVPETAEVDDRGFLRVWYLDGEGD